MDITYNHDGYQHEIELVNVVVETRNLSGGIRYNYVDYDIYSVNGLTDSWIISLFKNAIDKTHFDKAIIWAYQNKLEGEYDDRRTS